MFTMRVFTPLALAALCMALCAAPAALAVTEMNQVAKWQVPRNQTVARWTELARCCVRC